MIINSEGGVKQTIGQTTEYKTTIDIENLDFIATLLSSNLYSNPEDSFIREIVSNGWDSHVEAGNTKTPLLVRVKRNANYSYDITIRDYGTGLSKEQFENIYCKIGTSTKRSSNNYLGCFGIGKFATMAVSKVSYITSYYNGVARLYIMTKDGNSITTNLVSEQPTTEHNGLEITVKNIPSVSNYEKAINNLAFFPNVYVDGIYDATNKIKVKRFKYFSFATHSFTHKILLGNVLYPLDKTILPLELQSFYHSIDSSGLVFNFNIGELSVTPNRESIIYNSKVNDVIVNRIKEAKLEIESILKTTIGGDYKDPREYYDVKNCSFGFDFISNTKVATYYNSYNPILASNLFDLPITFCGKKANPTIVMTFGKLRPLCVRAVSDGNRLWKEKFPWQANRILDKTDTHIIMVKHTDKITKYIKEYLTEKYNSFIICNKFNLVDFISACEKEWLFRSRQTLNDEEKFIAQKCWEFMQKRFVYIDFENDKDFLDFKDKLKKEAKDNKITLNEKIILSVMLPKSNWAHKKNFYNYADVLKHIKSLNTGVLIRNLDTMQIGFLASRLGYVTIAANKKIVDLLRNERLKCEISENTIYKHKKIVLYKAVVESKLYTLMSDMTRDFVNTLPTELRQFLSECTKTIRQVSLPITATYLDKIELDEDLFNKCNVILNCFKSYCGLIDDLGITSSDNIKELVSYIIMKNKLYKISYDCYKAIKENKLLKAICEK